MSPYLIAGAVAVVALLVLAALVTWAVVLVRRFGVLAAAYRRQLAAESAMLEARGAELAAELARRTRNTDRIRRPPPGSRPREDVESPH